MPVTFQDVLAIALPLPGAAAGTSYRTPAVHIGRKLILRLWEDGETLVLRVDPAARPALTRRSPDAFSVTDHYRDYPYVLVYLPAASLDEVRPLILAAWKAVASKRQLAVAHVATAEIG